MKEKKNQVSCKMASDVRAVNEKTMEQCPQSSEEIILNLEVYNSQTIKHK